MTETNVFVSYAKLEPLFAIYLGRGPCTTDTSRNRVHAQARRELRGSFRFRNPLIAQ